MEKKRTDEAIVGGHKEDNRGGEETESERKVRERGDDVQEEKWVSRKK